MKTSARNQFTGVVSHVKPGAVSCEVQIKLDDENALVAVITQESAETLNVEVGQDITSLVKSSSVLLMTDEGIKTSARNHLSGEVSQIHHGPVNSEVTVTMKGGKSICAVVTHESVDSLGLVVGSRVCAVFKASSVILCAYN